MQNLSHIEVSEICNKLGKAYPKNIKRVYGGNIHSTWQVEFEKEKFFLKRNQREKKFLKFEECCLINLQEYINKEDLIIPQVVSYQEVNDAELLLMDWIDLQNGNQKKLGKGLGEMHLRSNELNPKKFGFPYDGFIGSTNQKGGWEKSWLDGFINLRIKPQLSAIKSDFLDFETINQIIEKIESQLINHKPNNTLVHGDLWSGNMGIEASGKGVIFDPACWWADSEVDIAMTRLFGGFKKEFYEEYHKVIPRKVDFEKRIIIYNFYHILNHANMFGGSYFNQVQDYIKEIINM